MKRWSRQLKTNTFFMIQDDHPGCCIATVLWINMFSNTKLKSYISCQNLLSSSFYLSPSAYPLNAPPTSRLTAAIVYLVKLIKKVLMPAGESWKKLTRGCFSDWKPIYYTRATRNETLPIERMAVRLMGKRFVGLRLEGLRWLRWMKALIPAVNECTLWFMKMLQIIF